MHFPALAKWNRLQHIWPSCPGLRIHSLHQLEGHSRYLSRHPQCIAPSLPMACRVRGGTDARGCIAVSQHEEQSLRPVDSSPEVEDSSDSATEWISFVLERIVSRGLLLQVLHSAGGKGDSTTPEQVVLVSCIRQAIDAMGMGIGAMGETRRPMRSNGGQ